MRAREYNCGMSVNEVKEAGFWSYAHVDDDSQRGRIARLSRDIAEEYRFLTGQEFVMFLDTDTLEPGDDLNAKIDVALEESRFFMPVITPSYLLSEYCRREFRRFVDSARALGLDELIIAVVWANVPGLGEGVDVDDEIVSRVNRFVWVDWRLLRFEERKSKKYRKAVSKIADRLASVARTPTSTVPAEDLVATEDDDDAPTFLESLDDVEKALPRLVNTLGLVGDEVTALGTEATAITEEISAATARGKGVAARLTIMRKFSIELTPRAERVEVLSTTFTNDLYSLDGGVRAALEFFAANPVEDAGERKARCEMAKSVLGLVAASRSGLGSVRGLADSMAQIENLSRDLRVPIRRLRKGFTLLAEGERVMDGWTAPASTVLEANGCGPSLESAT